MLGTAGGVYHFRDVITNGEPDAFFLMFSDAFCDFPLREMIHYKAKYMRHLMLTVKVGISGSNILTLINESFVSGP